MTRFDQNTFKKANLFFTNQHGIKDVQHDIKYSLYNVIMSLMCLSTFTLNIKTILIIKALINRT